MKKLFICLCAGLLSLGASYAQKKPLDEEAYKKWLTLSQQQMSNDGQWVTYRHANHDSLRVLYLYGNGHTDTIPYGTGASFSPDSHYFLYKQKTPPAKQYTFVLRSLSDGKSETFDTSSTLSFLGKKGAQVQIIRRNPVKKDSVTKKQVSTYRLTLYDPVRKDSVYFDEVKSHRYSPETDYLLLEQDGWTLYDRKGVKSYPLPVNGSNRIGTIAYHKSDLAAWVSFNAKEQEKNAIYVYDLKRGRLIDSLTVSAKTFPEQKVITNGQLSFSSDGKRLYCKLAAAPEKAETKAEPIDSTRLPFRPQIWSWDKPLDLLGKGNPALTSSDFYAYDLNKKSYTQLTTDEIPFLQFPSGTSEELTIGFSNKPYLLLEGIASGPQYDSYLIDMKTGERKPILKGKYYNPTISTDKNYLVWFEPDSCAWFSMDTHTMQKRNLTTGIDDTFHNDELDMPMHATPFGSFGWSDKGHSVLINSKYDVWKIDAAGKEQPVCLTQGQGRKDKIRFRLIKYSESQRYYNLDSTFYLNAFQLTTKKAGYYKLQGGNLHQLVFTDHYYSKPTFSEDGTRCIFRRESFTEYPELYLANADMKHIERISVSDDIQKDYLWGSIELVSWESFSKDTLQGLLCKPENFDPNKKYPMLIYYYEKKSDNLNRYNIPTPIGTVINWPYCASNGYLVFVPDIVFRPGEPGRSSYDAVVSGVKTLIDKCPYVDKDRIGLNGHSWGGYQSAYLITQTDLFKAAVAGAPVANMTSAYGGIRWGSGKSRMFQYEHTQSRIGGTLWEKPLAYFRNSALFYAPRIQTPLLIMHNDKDEAVMWEQGIELFMALRRLQKPVWMFNYRGQGHKLLKWDYRLDYSKRVMEFYDYYLKDGKKPDWMD